ncbi:MAG: DUF4134 domain-containing protein [Prevotellaceae bacterium]|nr:DUF4134 domain-containing protein [Prevotellaceae bacterium]
MKKFFVKAKAFCKNAVSNTVYVSRGAVLAAFMFANIAAMYAQNGTVSQDTGVEALGNTTTSLWKYVPAVQKICYAIAGVIAIAGAISVYIKMNNEEQDVKKSIMLIVGACIFLVAAATFLPKFFGYNG